MSTELHLLPPNGTSPLEPDEILGRLRAEFAFVETSREEGARRLLESISRWERTNPRVFEVAGVEEGSGEDVRVALIAALRASIPRACYVRFGDDAEHSHGQGIVPSTDGFLIVVDQPWQQVLAERLARVTGYVVHRI